MAFMKLMFPLSSKYLQEDSSVSATGEARTSTLSQAVEQLGLPVNDKVVIVGPDSVEKTSLVFQAAVSAAAAGIRTAYICTHPLKRLPAPIHGMAVPEPSIMSYVDFLYLEEAKELISWFAGIHVKPTLPGLVIVEDILAYASQLCDRDTDRNVDRSLAKLCAIITDSVEWTASQIDSKRCLVLMTAPSRIASLTPVLSHFHYRTATYEGGGKDVDSQLSYGTDESSITVKFCRKKDVIFVTDVHSSVLSLP